jgi:uncharacterized membrane protein
MKQRIILMAVMASVLLIHTAAFGAAYEYSPEDPGYEEVITKGKVLKIENAAAENDLGDVGIPLTVQKIEVEITSGDYRGRVLHVENHLMDDPGYDIIVEEGDRVELFLEVNDGGIEAAYITSYDRSVYAFYLAAAFIIVLLVVGGMKGLKATVSLAVMVFLIFKVLIPNMLKGYSPIMLSVVVTVISTVVTLLLIGGVTVKSFSAIIGTAGGVLTAAGIAVAVGKVARLTGMGVEEARMLLYIPPLLQVIWKNTIRQRQAAVKMYQHNICVSGNAGLILRARRALETGKSLLSQFSFRRSTRFPSRLSV